MSVKDKSTWPTLTVAELRDRLRELPDEAEVYVVLGHGLVDVMSAVVASVEDPKTGSVSSAIELYVRLPEAP